MIQAVLGVALAVGLQADEPPPVHLDAIVVDGRGGRVGDLSAADFELIHDGMPRALDSARFVRPASRLFAIFLDEFHISPGAPAQRARDAAARLLDRYIGPDDRVVVFKPLDSLLAIRLTADRAAAAAAIATLEGRRGLYDPRGVFERNYIAGAPARIEAVRTQIAISALHALARHLGGLDATRRTLVVISEGVAERTARGARGRESLPTLETVLRVANEANVAIYAVDPAGLAGVAPAHGPDSSNATNEARQTLQNLAAATSGEAVTDARDLDSALGRLAADAAAHYVLTFRPPESPATRAFRRIEVRSRRPNLNVRTRSGYWTAPPSETVVAAVTKPGRPPFADVPRRVSPLIRAWFGQSRGTDGRTRVSFVWEPAPDVPGVRRRVPAARIAFRALLADGQPLFEGPVRPVGSLVLDPAAGERTMAAFDAPAGGRVHIQMSIEDATARPLDTDVREIPVGELAGPVAIGSAEVFRARSAREYREITAQPSPVPIPGREFSRAERLVVRVPVYADGPVGVSARLMSRLGGTMRTLPVHAVSASAVYQTDLPLAGFVAGEYTIELTASGAAGQAREAVTFRVTP